MTDREKLKEVFLINQNLGDIKSHKLKTDASFRTYERIESSKKSYILMDAPPSKEQTKPFINIANFLRQNDLSAPEIIAQDTENGFLLLEDFGNDSFNFILNGESSLSSELNEEQIYAKAIDTLVFLHRLPNLNADIPNYDDQVHLREGLLFIDWYLAILNGEKFAKEAQEEFLVIMKHLLSLTKMLQDVVVLRDYHADNLMWLDDRVGHRKVGLLDFQDALIGSPAYDMVSLLEDARRDVSNALAEKMINRYLKAFPKISRKDFQVAYSILGVNRNLKIVGVFSRQAVKYRNVKYLSYLPRVWRYINHDLKHPLLFPLKQWLSKVVPGKIEA